MGTIKEALTFDDVLMLPRFSSILPSNTDISLKLTNNIKLKVPFLSSAMDTVTESNMAIAMAQEGGIGVIHRNLIIQKQSSEVKKVKNKKLLVGAAVGTNKEDFERAKALIDSGVDLIVIDTAHGHSEKVLKTLSKLKKIKVMKNNRAGKILYFPTFILFFNDIFFIFKEEVTGEVETIVQQIKFLFDDDPLLADAHTHHLPFETWYDANEDFEVVLNLGQSIAQAEKKRQSVVRARMDARAALKAKQPQGEPITPDVLSRLEAALVRADQVADVLPRRARRAG